MKKLKENFDINQKGLLIHGTYLPSAKFIYDHGLVSLNHFRWGQQDQKSHDLDSCPCCHDIPQRLNDKYTLRGDTFFCIMGNPIKGQSNDGPVTSFYGICNENIPPHEKNIPWGFPGFHFGVLYDPKISLKKWQDQYTRDAEISAFKGDKDALRIEYLVKYYQNIVNEVIWYAKGKGDFRFEYRYSSCIPYEDISAFVIPEEHCRFSQKFDVRFFMKSFEYNKKITSQRIFDVLAGMMERGDSQNKKPIYDTNNNLLYPV